jgi:hypothetical protein
MAFTNATKRKVRCQASERSTTKQIQDNDVVLLEQFSRAGREGVRAVSISTFPADMILSDLRNWISEIDRVPEQSGGAVRGGCQSSPAEHAEQCAAFLTPGANPQL